MIFEPFIDCLMWQSELPATQALQPGTLPPGQQHAVHKLVPNVPHYDIS